MIGCVQMVHVMVMTVQHSYKHPGNDPVKICDSLACYEVKQGIENSYHIVGIWFPILSIKKKVLLLAIHAAARLHNGIVDRN